MSDQTQFKSVFCSQVMTTIQTIKITDVIPLNNDNLFLLQDNAIFLRLESLKTMTAFS